MSIGLLSLIGLLIAILISCVSEINIGLLSIGMSYIIGVQVGGYKVKQILAGFPISLFMKLLGVMYLFTIALVNGTLEKFTKHIIGLAKGNAGILPFMVFFLTCFLAAIGPGNIAMTAIIAPLGMAIAGEARISALMMTVMVVNGANAGAFSPIAPTGIIGQDIAFKIGLGDVAVKMFVNTILGNFVIALLAYVMFGGPALFRQGSNSAAVAQKVDPFNRQQLLSITSIIALIAGVIAFKLDPGLYGLSLGVILILLGAADEHAVLKAMPWHPLLMVCGVSVLMAFAENAGGLDIFTTLVAQISTPYTVSGVLAFLAGLVSAYSSSSGVVMPAFLPLIPGLIAKLGGGNALAMASCVNVGSHVVDASPLSTGGAMCIAFSAAWVDKKKLFRDLMIWGLSMSVVGGLVTWFVFTVLGINV